MESTALNIALLSKKVTNFVTWLIFMESTALNIALLSKESNTFCSFYGKYCIKYCVTL